MQEPPATEASRPVEEVIARIRQVYAGWNRTTSIAQMRSDWDAFFPVAAVPTTVVPVDAGGVDARWITRPASDPSRVLLYFHGGGFKIGSTRSHEDLMARIAAAAQCRVLGLNFRLMPEFGFPAPLEDAVAAYRWLLAQGGAPAQVAFAGDSAGGGLVASAMLALREQGLPLPAAGVLLSALTDFEASGESYVSRSAADPIHQRAMILALARGYLGSTGDPRNPLASPLFGDLRGLPPLLLQVGDRETGLDDSTRFAAAARAAGVEVELEVFAEMIHVFQQFPDDLAQARDAIRQIGEFLTRAWSRP